MKRRVILVSVIAVFLLTALESVAAQQPQPRVIRAGSIIIGYLYTSGGWRLHICLAGNHSAGQGHGFTAPGRPVPRPGAMGINGGFYAQCRHGIIFLSPRTPSPANPSGVFPTPPPLPVPGNGMTVTNQIPTRVIRTAPPPPIPPLPPGAGTQLILMEAQRMPNSRSSGGRPPMPPPMPPLPQ